jgi:hypothetical protein
MRLHMQCAFFYMSVILLWYQSSSSQHAADAGFKLRFVWFHNSSVSLPIIASAGSFREGQFIPHHLLS